MLMFTMLFTVGAGYFLYVNQANTVYTKVLLARAGGISSQAEEALSLTTKLTAGGHISVYANNTGGIGVNITSLYILGSAGATLKCMGVGLPSGCTNGAPFPIWVNVGGGSGVIDTGYTPAAETTYILKIVTQRGSVFSTTYPQAATSLAARALSSGAIGDLYLNFSSYAFYTVAACAGNSAEYCLTYGGPGFAVPASDSAIAFSAQVTDLNPNQKNITLDQYSGLYQIAPSAATQSSEKLTIWYIVNATTSGVIQPTYNPITLEYNVPTTIVFASAQVMSSGFATQSAASRAGVIAAVSIVSHGWEGVSITQPYNYGQDMSFVSTLYT